MQIVRTAVSGLTTAAAIAVFAVAMPVVASAHGHHHHHHHAPASCNEMQMPVCGMKGGSKQTFTNVCWAKKMGASHIKKGACKW